MQNHSSLAKWGVAVLLLSSLSSCEDLLEQHFPKPNPTPPTIPTFPPLGQDIAFYALSGGTRLDAFSTANAATRISSVAITGLASGEQFLAIDFRPATGQLYGVSSASRLYVINQNTGAARAIGAGNFSPAVAGNLVGFDFNPTVDRIRLVTSTGQNLRLNPETGTVAATDGVLNGAAGATITGAAYTSNNAGATTTVLYDVDPATDQLYRQDPPNDGTLVSVGALNLNLSGNGGFDIDARTGTALGLYAVNGNPTLFTVDLTTGAARPLAQYAANAGYSGLAIPTLPVAYSTETFFLGRDGRSNTLNIFNPETATIRRGFQITGLAANDAIGSIDFRPANGQLYAVTDNGGTNRTKLYTLNLATGAATLVAELSISGFAGEIDFNPILDRIQILTADGRNLLVHPDNGTITEVAPFVNAPRASIAYDNNFAGTVSSTLYRLDAPNGKLYRRSSPTANTFEEVGTLGVTPVRPASFDIGGTTNTAYAFFFDANSNTRLHRIDLATGAATPIGGNFAFSGYYSGGLAVGLGF
jgi:hypothetical protein